MFRNDIWQNIPRGSRLEVKVKATPGVRCEVHGFFNSPQDEHDDDIDCPHHKQHQLVPGRSVLTVVGHVHNAGSLTITATLHTSDESAHPGSPLTVTLPSSSGHSGGIHLVLVVP
ncbi:hypothetical protein SCOR_19035 [Sulfidibacter corallicola]|uniref:Uncharacterized protein n=1 Tax=Sulfidibacter corallicola TaxID=2818388 RepID=A0A8A4TU13_SULCO|nr:hypothetical protein [Sulfidibacter corallicola]QTD53456.1 hypothetical protein J3U87_13460 [Sulfidibacter corallicola]